TPAVVISSPLQRAVSTAEAIGAAAHISVVIDDRLNDRDYGLWTGQPRAEVEHRFGSVDDAPGVEAAAMLVLRVSQDDDDGVIRVDDDPIRRTAPLGVLSGAVVGVVTALPSG
ncbi:MAG TPA: histidine phosphatase family protein, partial [Mycobacterium sp.]